MGTKTIKMPLNPTLWPTRSVAIATLKDLSVISIEGDDARSWLNGQVTQKIDDLAKGEARYSLVVNLKGRVMADMWVLCQGETFLLVVPATQVEELMKRFDDYIIMEDVEMSVLEDHSVVSVQGPRADEVAAQGWPVDRFGKGGRELIVANNDVESTLAELRTSAEKNDGGAVDEATWEQARINAGVAKFGVDFGDFTYPQEAGLQERAVSFEKGCYLGQEAVVMLEHRGKPPKRLIAVSAGAELEAGDEVNDGDKVVGKITSAARDVEDEKTWRGFALIKRDRVESDELVVGGA